MRKIVCFLSLAMLLVCSERATSFFMSDSYVKLSSIESNSTMGGSDFWTDQCSGTAGTCATCNPGVCNLGALGVPRCVRSGAVDGCSSAGTQNDCIDTWTGFCSPDSASACGSSMTSPGCPPVVIDEYGFPSCPNPGACVAGGSAWCDTCT